MKLLRKVYILKIGSINTALINAKVNVMSNLRKRVINLSSIIIQVNASL